MCLNIKGALRGEGVPLEWYLSGNKGGGLGFEPPRQFLGLLGTVSALLRPVRCTWLRVARWGPLARGGRELCLNIKGSSVVKGVRFGGTKGVRSRVRASREQFLGLLGSSPPVSEPCRVCTVSVGGVPPGSEGRRGWDLNRVLLPNITFYFFGVHKMKGLLPFMCLVLLKH